MNWCRYQQQWSWWWTLQSCHQHETGPGEYLPGTTITASLTVSLNKSWLITQPWMTTSTILNQRASLLSCLIFPPCKSAVWTIKAIKQLAFKISYFAGSCFIGFSFYFVMSESCNSCWRRISSAKISINQQHLKVLLNTLSQIKRFENNTSSISSLS